MSEEVKKEEIPHKHPKLRLGALIVVVLLVFVLFNVNLQKALNSPQFNQNINYIELQVKSGWQKLTTFFGDMFKNTINTDIGQYKKPGGLDFKAPILVDPNIIENKIGADKIRGYFNTTTDENIDKKFNEVYNPISTPVAN